MAYKVEKTNRIMLFMIQVVEICALLYFKSWYGMGCGIMGVFLTIADILFMRFENETNEMQKQKYKLSGLAIMLPAIALCGLSAYQLFQCFENKSSFVEIVIVCILIAIQMVVLIYSFILNRKNKSVVSVVLRHTEISIGMVQLSLLVSQLLWFGDKSDWAKMVCLTGFVLGGIIFLLGCNMLLCSFCGYTSTKQSIQFLVKQYRKRRRYFHYASLGKDGVMVLVKVILSILSQSFFMFANALFSCCIGIARYSALKMNQQKFEVQLKLFRRVSLILSGAGICYVGYSIRLFLGGKPGEYNMVMALAIALYTFVEFGVQICDLYKINKQKDMEAEALRLIGISSILISFVLTQTAIMSFAEMGEHSFSDGLAGVVFGGLVVFVGIAAQFRCFYYKRLNILDQRNGFK